MTSDIPPVDPSAALTQLGQAMASMHEIFRAAVDAGFSEDQALSIVLEALRIHLKP